MEITFAPRATGNIGRSLGRTLNDMRWPYIYTGCIGWLIIIAFMTLVWCIIVAGHLTAIAIVWYVQLHVWVIATPFVIIRAIRDQHRKSMYLSAIGDQEDIDNLRRKLG